MQRLHDNHGPNTISRALRYLELRLAGYPELGEFRTIVSGLRKSFAQEHGAFTEAQEARVAATAELGVLDDGVGRIALSIGQLALGLFDRNREHPKYRQLFPVSPTNMVTGVGGERQARFVSTLCATIKTDDAYLPLRDKGLELERLATRLNEAQARRQDLWQQEAAQRVKYELAADAVRREYNALYHQFMFRMPERAAEVETFFLQLTPSGRRAAGADTPADEPADV